MAVKSGFLKKQSGGKIRTWNERWFVLKGDQLHYSKEEDGKPIVSGSNVVICILATLPYIIFTESKPHSLTPFEIACFSQLTHLLTFRSEEHLTEVHSLLAPPFQQISML